MYVQTFLRKQQRGNKNNYATFLILNKIKIIQSEADNQVLHQDNFEKKDMCISVRIRE